MHVFEEDLFMFFPQLVSDCAEGGLGKCPVGSLPTPLFSLTPPWRNWLFLSLYAKRLNVR